MGAFARGAKVLNADRSVETIREELGHVRSVTVSGRLAAAHQYWRSAQRLDGTQALLRIGQLDGTFLVVDVAERWKVDVSISEAGVEVRFGKAGFCGVGGLPYVDENST